MQNIEDLEINGCVLANSYNQSVVTDSDADDKNYEYIDIFSKFKVAFLKNELKNFQKKYLISPYLLLYKFFLEKKDEKGVYLLNQKNYITIAIFKDEKPVFAKHLKKSEDFALDSFILDAISKFYKKECCFFLEKVFLYDVNELKDDEIKNLYESILLDIEFNKIDIEKLVKNICEDEKFLKYAYENQNINKEFVFPKWLKFSAISVFVILIVFDIYVKYQNFSLQNEVLNLQGEKVGLQEDVEELKEDIETLEKIVPIVQEIKSQNSLIVSNIKNVFDIVPDPIVLYKAEFEKNSLVLEGFTPNKRVFEKFLNKRLKNFYQKIDVTFKKVKNGYIFKSINKDIVKGKR